MVTHTTMDVRYTRHDLFPEIEPYVTGRLRLDDRHVMYWEQSGNPRGVPVLFVHGGPGAGAATAHRRFFDPRYYRVIIFDQRGCGRSTPHADTINNTTDHLVADIETLRRHLSVDRWILFGGSWGSTIVGLDARTGLWNTISRRLRRVHPARHLSRHRP